MKLKGLEIQQKVECHANGIYDKEFVFLLYAKFNVNYKNTKEKFSVKVRENKDGVKEISISLLPNTQNLQYYQGTIEKMSKMVIEEIESTNVSELFGEIFEAFKNKFNIENSKIEKNEEGLFEIESTYGKSKTFFVLNAETGQLVMKDTVLNYNGLEITLSYNCIVNSPAVVKKFVEHKKIKLKKLFL